MNKEHPWLNSLWSVSRKHASILLLWSVTEGKKRLLGCYPACIIASSTDRLFFSCLLLFCPAGQNLNQKQNIWERTYLLKHEIVHSKVLKKLWASNAFWLFISWMLFFTVVYITVSGRSVNGDKLVICQEGSFHSDLQCRLGTKCISCHWAMSCLSFRYVCFDA